MSSGYQIVVCGSLVPDPWQTLEPIETPAGPALKNEMMLPAVLDPGAAHALFEAAHLAQDHAGSQVWLLSLGPKAKLAIPELLNCLKDPELNIRLIVAPTLAYIGGEPEIVVPALIESLDDPSPHVRHSAASSLRVFGDPAKPAVPRLVTLLTSGDTYFIRAGAAEALGEIGTEASAAIPSLQAACSDSNSLVRQKAKTALRGITPQQD